LRARHVIAALAASGALLAAKALRTIEEARLVIGPGARAIAEEVEPDRVATAAQLASQAQPGGTGSE
jgi:hypothetical protein